MNILFKSGKPFSEKFNQNKFPRSAACPFQSKYTLQINAICQQVSYVKKHKSPCLTTRALNSITSTSIGFIGITHVSGLTIFTLTGLL